MSPLTRMLCYSEIRCSMECYCCLPILHSCLSVFTLSYHLPSHKAIGIWPYVEVLD